MTLERLKEIKDEVFSRKDEQFHRERWDTFCEIAQSICDACGEEDLVALAISVKNIKNKLRRPSVKKDLAKSIQEQKEQQKKEKKEKKEKKYPEEGEKPEVAKCSSCGKVIKGAKPVQGIMCTKCAFGDGEE